jgi:hypothetical protein
MARRATQAALVALAAALAAAGCKVKNLAYCPGAPFNRCVDAGITDIMVGDAAGESAGDGGATADAAVADTYKGCSSDDDCRGNVGGPGCNPATRSCVACTANKHCSPDAGAGVCDTAAHACVACVTSADCADPTKPICRANACGACKTDSECVDRNGADPGVCMAHQDGRCATDAETIYVQNISGVCSSDVQTGGTKAAPFCRSQMAVDRVSPTQRLVVLRGADMSPWTATVSGAQATVVGQLGASIVPGVDPGISIASGDVYVRNVIIDGGHDVGVKVANGSIIRLDRVIIRNNTKGGLVAQGTGFEVVNSVFDSNGGSSVGSSSFAGAFLGMTSLPGAPHVFHYNTLINNKDKGVVCEAATQMVSGLLMFGNMTGDYVNCMPPTYSKLSGDGDPAFDTSRPYHLTAASPCVSAGDPSDVPPDDLDGQARPNDVVDCGADEFYAQ